LIDFHSICAGDGKTSSFSPEIFLIRLCSPESFSQMASVLWIAEASPKQQGSWLASGNYEKKLRREFDKLVAGQPLESGMSFPKGYVPLPSLVERINMRFNRGWSDLAVDHAYCLLGFTSILMDKVPCISRHTEK
jgi:hypothetical protein